MYAIRSYYEPVEGGGDRLAVPQPDRLEEKGGGMLQGRLLRPEGFLERRHDRKGPVGGEPVLSPEPGRPSRKFAEEFRGSRLRLQGLPVEAVRLLFLPLPARRFRGVEEARDSYNFV